MTKVPVAICGPNLRDQSRGEFHVHAAGCSDLKHYGPGREIGGEEPYVHEVESDLGVAEVIYGDFEGFEEDPDLYLADFYFAPCVPKFNTNPKEAAVSDQTEQTDAAAEAAAKKAEAKQKREAAAAKKKAEAKAKKEAAAKARAEKKAAADAEKAKRAEERKNRPKKVALTLSQRRHVLILAKAGSKGVKVQNDQTRKAYDYFVENGLATKSGTELYKATDAGKARAKDVPADKYKHEIKAPKPPKAKPAKAKPAETAAA